jgi:hypothetical protein
MDLSYLKNEILNITYRRKMSNEDELMLKRSLFHHDEIVVEKLAKKYNFTLEEVNLVKTYNNYVGGQQIYGQQITGMTMPALMLLIQQQKEIPSTTITSSTTSGTASGTASGTPSGTLSGTTIGLPPFSGLVPPSTTTPTTPPPTTKKLSDIEKMVNKANFIKSEIDKTTPTGPLKSEKGKMINLITNIEKYNLGKQIKSGESKKLKIRECI